RDQLVAERLARKNVAIRHRAVALLRDFRADAAGIGEGDHGAAVRIGLGCRQLGVGDDIAKRALAGIVGPVRQRFGNGARRAVRERRRDPVIGRQQRGLAASLAVTPARTMKLSALVLTMSRVARSSLTSMAVTMVPYLSALVTSRPSISQT